MRSLIPVIVLPLLVSSLKFLAYNPQIANSHVNFMGKISDVLVDAGHEVVMLSPITDTQVGSAGCKKCRVIEIPQCEFAANFGKWMMSETGLISSVWRSENVFKTIMSFEKFSENTAQQCNVTLHTPGLLDSLRAEKFDVAYAEYFDHCGWGIFHLLGIEKLAITQSMSTIDGGFAFTHTPTNPAYVPSMMGGQYGDQMTFFQRMYNFATYYASARNADRALGSIQKIFEDFHPGIPMLEDLLAKNSLVFMNAEPLMDFPKPTTHRIIDIGGIVVSNGHKKLNETWSEIMELRPKTILLSFGTFAKSYLMPEEYKATIRKTLTKFPDVTFIWKYEKPQHNVSRGIPNIIESTWVPQHDMLYDPRLTAFITHCGQGSMMESVTAGIPLIAIPVSFDQLRNAQLVKRNQVGVTLFKEELVDSQTTFEDAIREILSEDKYAKNARRLANMLRDRPFKMRETFVKNMEFLAEYGPLRQLDHYGTKLNFFQYYLIDIFAFFAVVGLLSLGFVFALLRVSFRILSRFIVLKKKVE